MLHQLLTAFRDKGVAGEGPGCPQEPLWYYMKYKELDAHRKWNKKSGKAKRQRFENIVTASYAFSFRA